MLAGPQKILLFIGLAASWAAGQEVSFNRDIRPILSNRCFACHGPDPKKTQGDLQLDTREHAMRASGEAAPLVPGNPDASLILARVTESDDDLRMPPADAGPRLTASEIDTLRRWIAAGAEYESHWAYVPPSRPALPPLDQVPAEWGRQPLDRFVLAAMRAHGLEPSPPADLRTLARRVSLDLTGLPPTGEEVEALLADPDPQAYERWVDALLSRPAYGEHWARAWLDLARYADSAGYADDPPRTIWAYRDWVIRALNSNMPFDRFTLEQLAGDLLPTPSEDQLIATAFHRNTQTNNEGGTNNEEFRNVAIVDRVNTTFAVWMGTTMACAQCHHHKYDPLSQEDYFRVFAIFDNTEDADLPGDTPVLPLYTAEQLERRQTLTAELAAVRRELETPTAALAASQAEWETRLRAAPDWRQPVVHAVRASGGTLQTRDDGSLFAEPATESDTYTLEFPVGPQTASEVPIAALRLETIPDPALPNGGAGWGGGNFVITSVRGQFVPSALKAPAARFVRVQLSGSNRILSLAEVQVFVAGENVAPRGTATQSSTEYDGPATLAIDRNTDGVFTNKSVTHTASSENPWWELDLGSMQTIERIAIWNRMDPEVKQRLGGFELQLLDADRSLVWQHTESTVPDPQFELLPSNVRELQFSAATADYAQDQFPAASVLVRGPNPAQGWAVGGSTNQPHALVLTLAEPWTAPEAGLVRLQIEQNSVHRGHLLGRLRLGYSGDESTIARAQLPSALQAIVASPPAERNDAQQAQLATYYRETIAPELAAPRDAARRAQAELEQLKPETSVLIMRELREQRRTTRLQYRGNYLDQGPEMQPGLPAAFGVPLDPSQPVDRLALARWLVDPRNPLTARVLVNRYWEALFGRGLVATSEEFGSQGDPPSHPELLDWLASELLESGWDTKKLLKQIVLSATYRQTSAAIAERIEHDRDNRWLSRGPRVRLSGEAIRDQALAVSGLLSRKLHGPPVRPPQPNLGLTAAFGGSTDWMTSEGEDRYRRSLYTTWRRSNPYPSMATFDAPNREVCVVRRNQTNTPLQALVTLNDPVYIEAAQALARRMAQQAGPLEAQLRFGFQTCLTRPPESAELAALQQLWTDARQHLAQDPAAARQLASEPLGPLPGDIDPVDAAALTVVANVLLNLDEMIFKR